MNPIDNPFCVDCGNVTEIIKIGDQPWLCTPCWAKRAQRRIQECVKECDKGWAKIQPVFDYWNHRSEEADRRIRDLEYQLDLAKDEIRELRWMYDGLCK